MEFIKKDQNSAEDRSDAPIFYGGKVEGRGIVGEGKSTYFNFNQVTFYNGSKNYFHEHTSDQILFGLSGNGYVANESQQLEMESGDTALIPAGEKHWHGAQDGQDFSHISLTHPDSQTTVYPD